MDITNKALDVINNLNIPNKIWEACYKYYLEPDILKKQTQTKVDCRLIEQEGELELIRRAQLRAIKEEKNIESILNKSSKYIENQENIENPDEDWINYFFDKAKLISNEEIQEIWAKLLAGELQKPGSKSKRLLNLICQIDKTEAQDIMKLSKFVLVETFGPILLLPSFSENEQNYSELGINSELVQNLESLGLISTSFPKSFDFDITEKTRDFFGKNNDKLKQFLENSDSLVIEKYDVCLTNLGKEFYSIINSEFDFNVTNLICRYIGFAKVTKF